MKNTIRDTSQPGKKYETLITLFLWPLHDLSVHALAVSSGTPE